LVVVLEPITLAPKRLAMKGMSAIWSAWLWPREDVVGAADNVEDSLFVSFPFFHRDCLLAR